MYWDVVKVIVKGELMLWVSFADGTAGYVKFLKQFLTGVFEPLKDPHYFQKVSVADGVVVWPGEIDLAPDAMYHAITKHGECVLK
jgi:hypothetical protein